MQLLFIRGNTDMRGNCASVFFSKITVLIT